MFTSSNIYYTFIVYKHSEPLKGVKIIEYEYDENRKKLFPIGDYYRLNESEIEKINLSTHYLRHQQKKDGEK